MSIVDSACFGSNTLSQNCNPIILRARQKRVLVPLQKWRSSENSSLVEQVEARCQEPYAGQMLEI